MEGDERKIKSFTDKSFTLERYMTYKLLIWRDCFKSIIFLSSPYFLYVPPSHHHIKNSKPARAEEISISAALYIRFYFFPNCCLLLLTVCVVLSVNPCHNYPLHSLDKILFRGWSAIIWATLSNTVSICPCNLSYRIRNCLGLIIIMNIIMFTDYLVPEMVAEIF